MTNKFLSVIIKNFYEGEKKILKCVVQ